MALAAMASFRFATELGLVPEGAVGPAEAVQNVTAPAGARKLGRGAWSGSKVMVFTWFQAVSSLLLYRFGRKCLVWKQV